MRFGRAQATMRGVRRPVVIEHDFWLIGLVLALQGIGLVMVTSASMSLAEARQGAPLFFMWHQMLNIGVGCMAGWLVYRLPVGFWERNGGTLLLVGYLLLALVLLPGIGRSVNGSMRWLNLGPMTLQPSELLKVFAIVFVAGYAVRRMRELQASFTGFTKPLMALAVGIVLLMLEPDFGSVVVILATVLGMLFLAGVRWGHYLLVVGGTAAIGAVLAYTSPYRLERLTTFANPWADPFGSGFQLTQALIAFGQGGWFGVGLGGSIQKLSYLPEAHTDFVIAVLAEELGVAGLLVVIALFALLVMRAWRIGRDAEQAGSLFGAHVAYGIAMLIALQVFINIGVNMGLLPTKGLTLPLVSYGGSSMLSMCIAIGMLLRIAFETHSCDFGRRLDKAGVRYTLEARA